MQLPKKIFSGEILYNIIRAVILIYLLIYICLLIPSLLGIQIGNFSPTEMVFSSDTENLQRFHKITWRHPFGTDYYGYDLFSQIYAGLKTNFIFSLITTVVFLIFGVFFGIRLGYYKGKDPDFDDYINEKYYQGNKKFRFSLSRLVRKITYHNHGSNMMERILYVFNSFPLLVLVLLSILFIGVWIRSTNMRLAIEMALFGLFSSPRLASMIIGKIKTLRAEEFIQSSIALGLSDSKIIWKHILLKECKYIILFQCMYMMGQATILEITLTYLQYGAQFPWVSWGAILDNMKTAPLHPLIIFPILFITLTISMYMRLAEEIKMIEDRKSL